MSNRPSSPQLKRSRYDWAVPFGFDHSSYHTSFSTIRFLRVFQANPRPGEAAGRTDKDVLLYFNVAQGMTAVYQGLVDADRDRWDSIERESM